MSAPLQTFSHYPAWPTPVDVPAIMDADHACPYLPGRTARMRAFLARRMDANVYHRFMDAGFRRSGTVIYQPVCSGCRQCVPMRVVVDRFHANKSQRRCWRRNADLSLTIDRPAATEEKYDLYRRYLRDWHADGVNDASWDGFASFLYQSPVNSIEFMYRDMSGKLLAAGLSDVADHAFSSVYFYFDPDCAARGLGTYGVLREVDYARNNNMAHYYFGYWIAACASMRYKGGFRPNEVLCTDGAWRELASDSDSPPLVE